MVGRNYLKEAVDMMRGEAELFSSAYHVNQYAQASSWVKAH